MKRHAYRDGALCLRKDYVASVVASGDIDAFGLRDLDCGACIRRLLDKHTALAELFRAQLAVLSPPHNEATDQMRMLSTRALCHECLALVETIDGKLATHGCTLNDAPVQIYLHPLVAWRIAQLETLLAIAQKGQQPQ